MTREMVEEVLGFWLGASPDEAITVQEKQKLWFSGGEDLDREIRDRFEPALKAIASLEQRPWESGARGRLASIVVLDQFSRNIYRGSARAFAQDPLAQRLTLEGLERSDQEELAIMEQVFFSFPLHHAEDLVLQRRWVEIVGALAERAPSHLQAIVRGNHEYAVEHCEVIERFGRFPHRNEVLGRASTPEEIAYLEGGASRYGQ